MGRLRGALVAATVLAAASTGFPAQPEEPWAVWVFTEDQRDAEDGDSLAKTAEEIGKRIRDRKEWFRLAERREEADLVVEVVAQARGRVESSSIAPRNETTVDPDRELTRFLDVGKAFTVETKVLAGDEELFPLTVSAEGRRPRDVARPYALRLETMCRLNEPAIREAVSR